jgi:hypothetical protein
MTRCGLCHRPVKDRQARRVLVFFRPAEKPRQAPFCPACAKELVRGWRR